jgi:formylglycine-generating enzyme required for sulfatase activity
VKNCSNLRSFFGGLALLAGVHSLLAQPALSIIPTGRQSVLYWSTTLTNYLLQTTTNLASVDWVSTNETAFLTGFVVSNTTPPSTFQLVAATPPVGMALIPAGWFTMGNSINDSDITDANPTNIYLSAFYMDVNLVTSNQWRTVHTYAIANGYGFDHPGLGKSGNHPVHTVSWYDCVKWCNARSQNAGLTPVYYTDAGLTVVFKSGTATPYVNWAANGYRLPTEAEWEKAARGGLNGQRFPWGNRIDENQANYVGAIHTYDLGPTGYNPIGVAGGIQPYTTPVGSFDMNGYGLYDMAGNVYQWCWDWYGTPYGQPSQINPTGPSSGSARTARGGYWGFTSSLLRCFCRSADSAFDMGYAAAGFRCVKGL